MWVQDDVPQLHRAVDHSFGPSGTHVLVVLNSNMLKTNNVIMRCDCRSVVLSSPSRITQGTGSFAGCGGGVIVIF